MAKDYSLLTVYDKHRRAAIGRPGIWRWQQVFDPQHVSVFVDKALTPASLNGYGQSPSNLFSNDFRTFRFGVAFSFPVKNRAAEGQLGRAVAQGRKIGAQRKTLEQTIEVEVRNAVQAVETGRQRVETARASREAAAKQSESEQRRFQAGLSTTYFVLERQNNLSAAQGRELKAMTDYSKAVTELQRVMGTTLTSANVQVSAAANK